MDMIVLNFKKCIVCNEDVATFPDELLPMCSSHSDEDKGKALFRLQRVITEKLKDLASA
jgi:hypothetical protein